MLLINKDIMPVTLKILTNAAILIAEYKNEVITEDVQKTIDETLKLLNAQDGTVYRISDYTMTNLSLSTIYNVFREYLRATKGSLSDRNVYDVFVGDNRGVHLLNNFLVARGATYLFFETLDDAMTHINHRIESNHESNGDPAYKEPTPPE